MFMTPVARALAVPFRDRRCGEAAHACVHACAGAHRQHQHDLVGARRPGHAHFDGIEVAAHIAGVDVCQRHVERGTGRTDLLGARHDGQCIAALAGGLALGIRGRIALPAEQFAHRIAAGHVPQRAVFELAGGADDRALAVALDALGRHRHRVEQAARHLQADRVQRFHHRHDVALIAAGERICQHRSYHAAPQRGGRRRAELVEDVFHLGQDATDLNHGVAVVIASKDDARGGTVTSRACP
jgi:hypothetical protein